MFDLFVSHSHGVVYITQHFALCRCFKNEIYQVPFIDMVICTFRVSSVMYNNVWCWGVAWVGVGGGRFASFHGYNVARDLLLPCTAVLCMWRGYMIGPILLRESRDVYPGVVFGSMDT